MWLLVLLPLVFRASNIAVDVAVMCVVAAIAAIVGMTGATGVTAAYVLISRACCSFRA